jgi:hypothetical protein
MTQHQVAAQQVIRRLKLNLTPLNLLIQAFLQQMLGRSLWPRTVLKNLI